MTTSTVKFALRTAIFAFALTLLTSRVTFGWNAQFTLPFLSAKSKPAREAQAEPSATQPRSPERYARADDESSVHLDLSPQFSHRLPYSTTLGRVVCEADFPLDSVVDLQAEIVQLQKDLVDFLAVPEAREKIELCLFKDMNSYREFIAEIFPGAPTDRPALYVKDKDVGVLMVPNDPRMVLNVRHEMTHAYLNASLQNVPIWIDEGLAKYFEIPPGERGFRNPYLEDMERNVSGLFSSPPSLSRLEKLTTVGQMKSREYRESWSWVHYMMHYSPRTQRVLSNYLRSLRREAQRGISPRDAANLQKQSPLKRALEEFEPNYKREYVEHFKNWERLEADYESRRADSFDDERRARAADAQSGGYLGDVR